MDDDGASVAKSGKAGFATRPLELFRVSEPGRVARLVFAFLSIRESSPLVCDPSRAPALRRRRLSCRYRAFNQFDGSLAPEAAAFPNYDSTAVRGTWQAGGIPKSL
jgi:hypothetical protein